jgi:peptide/nickel transport system permease protein
MARYLLNRLWQSAVTLVLASIVVFIGIRALPGDPALAMAGEEADPATLAAVRAQLGLDQPVPVQYLHFVGNALTGDLGRSTRTGTPVTEMIGATLPVTVQLAFYAMIVAVLAGIAGGVLASVFRGRWPDWMANGFSLAGLSIPTFWLGILAVVYLAVGLGWFPASGYVSPLEDPLRAVYYLTLPAVSSASRTRPWCNARPARRWSARSPPTTSEPPGRRGSAGERSCSGTRCATA